MRKYIWYLKDLMRLEMSQNSNKKDSTPTSFSMEDLRKFCEDNGIPMKQGNRKGSSLSISFKASEEDLMKQPDPKASDETSDTATIPPTEIT